MTRTIRLAGLVLALFVVNLLVWSANRVEAMVGDDGPCFNRLCHVMNQPNFPSYCYGWPFAHCRGDGNCCSDSGDE
jgi:hypothetical protein